MIKLEGVTINKYKCIENPQEFAVEPQTTVLVGMNESGKTSILEALAKTNYFEDDNQFKFNLTKDYPRKQKKAVDKSGENPKAITLNYSIDDELLKEIEEDIGAKLTAKQFSITTKYDGKRTWTISLIKVPDYIAAVAKEHGITDKKTIAAMTAAKNQKDLQAALTSVPDEDGDEEEVTIADLYGEIEQFFENAGEWDNPIENYIVTEYLIPNLPKFMYYDDYYMLPSRVSLNNIEATPTDPANKTAKALLELADIDVSKVMQSMNFEDFVAELEATQLNISEELFKYWSTNTNLGILFSIDKQPNQTRIVDYILDIRVQNKRSGVSLPLGNRSKGFNWFFSFLVWFKKIGTAPDMTH
ncbi:hypothetical protein FACS1894104_3560 [Actinomycetota bacterium]|nr:hypothetical protein FACS1894104_3560 [Actinomycetota bacterium]